ncbi:MAG: site-specific DNA-methyltransferase [Dehalococcoidia bacterium]|nr:site-specific DNA-methyltransferase [Dehalococcoidia bacterium]
MPELDFKGKQHIYAHHLTVPYRPLVPDAELSLNPTAPDDNLIIHGDNLDALKALLPRYAGRVKCIYIDPPYNTGNEGWVYNDKVNSPLMREWLQENGSVDGEDLERHDKWLCMMWPRLHLLKELLADDGVIFVSIDDNEQHHLRMLMDEIFGESSFLAELVWKSRQNIDNRNVTGVSIDHEYVLCYGTSLRGDERKAGQYSNPDNDPRGDWASGNMVGLATKESRPNLHFDLIDPETGINYGCPPRGWRYDQEGMARLISEGRILWPETPEGRPRVKVFLKDLKNRFTGFSSIVGDGVFTRNGTREIEEIFSSRVFDFPKSHELIQQLILQGCPDDGIVMDSFAGSGTTAHAVLALNKEDGRDRKFILVECEDYADTITAERVRRVINGVPDLKDKSLREGLGGSFTYCTLGSPIELEGMLAGDALPPYSALAAYLLHTASGISAGAADLERQNEDGLFYSDERTDYYLLYEPNVDWLCSNQGMLNLERSKRISEASRGEGKRAIVFGPGKYIGQRDLTGMGITFCQLPYEMHKSGQ